MITIKNAFRLKNIIKRLQQNCFEILFYPKAYFCNKIETHKKSELSNKIKDLKIEDKIINLNENTDIKYDFKRMFDLYMYLNAEMVKLENVLAIAKTAAKIGDDDLTYDAAVIKAKQAREILTALKECNMCKNTVSTTYGNETLVSNEIGSYSVPYEIETKTEYDLYMLSKSSILYNDLAIQTDMLSDEIESVGASQQIVNYEPKFHAAISFEELYKIFDKE